jgi:hypothetical protein
VQCTDRAPATAGSVLADLGRRSRTDRGGRPGQARPRRRGCAGRRHGRALRGSRPRRRRCRRSCPASGHDQSADLFLGKPLDVACVGRPSQPPDGAAPERMVARYVVGDLLVGPLGPPASRCRGHDGGSRQRGPLGDLLRASVEAAPAANGARPVLTHTPRPAGREADYQSLTDTAAPRQQNPVTRGLRSRGSVSLRSLPSGASLGTCPKPPQ